MFETLSDRLQEIFNRLGSKGRLDEADVDTVMKEVRRALLEADVNFKVVKDFVATVKERAVGAEVFQSLTPAQQVVQIVHEELINLLGEPAKMERAAQPPTVYMLIGLQGSGKTTTGAKLGLQLRRAGQNPLLVAADTQRPAAIHQLETLGKQIQVPVYSEGNKVSPVVIAQNAVRYAREHNNQVVIIDTAGRLQIDEQLMNELIQMKAQVNPT